jgi:hypothetical protein
MTSEPVTVAGETITIAMLATLVATTTLLITAIRLDFLAGPYQAAGGVAAMIFLVTFVVPRVVARWFGTTLNELWGTPP